MNEKTKEKILALFEYVKEVLIKVPPISKDISTGLEVNIL